MEQLGSAANGGLPEDEETEHQPEATRSALSPAEIRLAREALGDRLWGPVTKGMLADLTAREQAADEDQPSRIRNLL